MGESIVGEKVNYYLKEYSRKNRKGEKNCRLYKKVHLTQNQKNWRLKPPTVMSRLSHWAYMLKPPVETADSTKPYVYWFFVCLFCFCFTVHTYDKVYSFFLAYLNCHITSLAFWGHS